MTTAIPDACVNPRIRRADPHLPTIPRLLRILPIRQIGALCPEMNVASQPTSSQARAAPIAIYSLCRRATRGFGSGWSSREVVTLRRKARPAHVADSGDIERVLMENFHRVNMTLGAATRYTLPVSISFAR